MLNRTRPLLLAVLIVPFLVVALSLEAQQEQQRQFPPGATSTVPLIIRGAEQRRQEQLRQRQEAQQRQEQRRQEQLRQRQEAQRRQEQRQFPPGATSTVPPAQGEQRQFPPGATSTFPPVRGTGR